MRLQEEYVKRHGLDYLPIYHVKNSNLVLQVDKDYIILNIKWQEVKRTPGYYVFNYLKPQVNCYPDLRFKELGVQETVQYEEYADWLIRWSINLNVKNIEFEAINQEKIKFVVWRMFLLCFDNWFKKNNLKVEPITEDVEGENYISKFLVGLLRRQPELYEIYCTEFHLIEMHYADWLVNLINHYSRG